MTTSIRENIIASITSNLSVVTISNGYLTDCGSNIFRAVTNITSTPCLNVLPKADSYSHSYGVVNCIMPLTIQGIVDFGSTNPSIMSDRVLGDLHKIIYTTNFAGTTSYILSVVSGGTDYYPSQDRDYAGAQIVLSIKYDIVKGDPFTQP